MVMRLQVALGAHGDAGALAHRGLQVLVAFAAIVAIPLAEDWRLPGLNPV